MEGKEAFEQVKVETFIHCRTVNSNIGDGQLQIKDSLLPFVV